MKQLAGFSDPVYAEAYVNVNQYDIVLDVLIVNQTSDTLQNVCLELSTVGDLKLVDKPMPLTLAPHDFANIKVSSFLFIETASYFLKLKILDSHCFLLWFSGDDQSGFDREWRYIFNYCIRRAGFNI